MEKKDLIYEGKAKKLFKTEDSSVVWVEYLDQATALNGVRKDVVVGKSIMNNQITSLIFNELKRNGVENHFIRLLSKNEQLIEKLTILPLEVVIRNYAAGSFSKRLAVDEGVKLTFPILEFYFKEDSLDDPFINEDHIRFLKIATDSEIHEIKEAAHQINRQLIKLFKEIGIRLIDFKIEFGKREDGTILLADEITPDTCRLWDEETNEHLDKDVYRRNLGEIIPVYQEVLTRLENKFK
ncbi:phosphoribosylaminoimidazolesuccinocarboxamide synthase [Enterococcus sp. LJL99]